MNFKKNINGFVAKIEENRILNYTISFVVLLLIVGISVSYIVSANKSFFGADASYYLGVTEQIYKGRIPIKDFALGYTPLSFYLMLIPRMFMGSTPDYPIFLFANYFFSFLSALLTGLIVKHLTSSKTLTLITIFLYLLFNYILEGIYFYLEPFSNAFGLLGVYLILKHSEKLKFIFIAGILAGLSFLSKQFGLIYFGCLGLMLLFENNTFLIKSKKIGFLFLGFLFSLFLVFLYFGLNDVSPKILIQSFSGGGYGERTFKEYTKGISGLLKMFPFMLLFPFIIFFEKRKETQVMLLIIFITFAVGTLQFVFQSFLHYSIYMLPFFLTIVIVGLRNRNTVLRLIVVLMLTYSGLIYSNKAFKRTRSIAQSEIRAQTIMQADEMKNILKNYSVNSMYVLDGVSIPYYFYLNIDPSMMKEYGYAFGFESNEQVFRRTKNADLVLVSKDGYENLSSPIKQVIDSDKFIREETQNFCLFVK